jgi:hypothetical protein
VKKGPAARGLLLGAHCTRFYTASAVEARGFRRTIDP